MRFRYEPQTGDEKLDLDLWQRQEEWARSARACDVAGGMTFAEIERLAAFVKFPGFLVASPRWGDGWGEGGSRAALHRVHPVPTRPRRRAEWGTSLAGVGRLDPVCRAAGGRSVRRGACD